MHALKDLLKLGDDALMSDMTYARFLWAGMFLSFLGQLQWAADQKDSIGALFGALLF